MIKHSDETKQFVLELLKAKRSQKEIEKRTGVPAGTIQDWAAGWRKSGELLGYARPGFEFTLQAKNMSNGYYKCIRKRYLGMKWTDKLEQRIFGFNSPVEAIHYYLDENGLPRKCTYCGKIPPKGKVWGLDRLDSSLGHIPGNLVPCCTGVQGSYFLSCQASKSKFSLQDWMCANMSRTFGIEISNEQVSQRLKEVYNLAKNLERK